MQSVPRSQARLLGLSLLTSKCQVAPRRFLALCCAYTNASWRFVDFSGAGRVSAYVPFKCLDAKGSACCLRRCVLIFWGLSEAKLMVVSFVDVPYGEPTAGAWILALILIAPFTNFITCGGVPAKTLRLQAFYGVSPAKLALFNAGTDLPMVRKVWFHVVLPGCIRVVVAKNVHQHLASLSLSQITGKRFTIFLGILFW